MFTITSIGISNSNHRYIGLSNLNIIRFIFFLSLRGERCFLVFQSFGECRRRAFFIFCSSADAEALFLKFFGFRQVPTTCFFVFYLVGECRGVVFEILCLSVGAEALFYMFSSHPRPWKRMYIIDLPLRNAPKDCCAQQYFE